MPSFYNGKRFFLTYPRCDVLPCFLALWLEERAPTAYWLVAQEEHEDGGKHLHACVEFTRTQRHAVDWLDYEGHHPNKQDPRKWEACKQYCKKDGVFIEGPDSAKVDNTRMAPSEHVKTFDTESEWYDYCVKQRISYQYAVWYWNSIRPDPATILENDHDGIVCEPLRAFAFNPDERRALILIGPSGCGKTTWAKRNTPKPCLFVSHIDDLRKFRSGYHIAILFDDVNFTHWPRESQIHLVDFDDTRSIHVRYATATIPAKTYRIFTANIMPVNGDDEAIRRRINVRRINL